MRRYIPREGRFGFDRAVEDAIGQVIDSHVVEMRVEILRQQKAEDAELGELAARLDGLAAMYREDEQHQSTTVKELRYQRGSARRRVEDRDTSMPAGPDGVEERGYQHGNVGELAGRGVRTRIILWIVLCLAMSADLIAFRQVVERVVNDSLVLPLVVAITATTTYIAHRTGELLKTAKDISRDLRRAVGAWALAAIWTVMGIGIFLVRLLAPPPASANAMTDFVNSGATPPGSDGSPALSAMLLLFLYVLTGAVAVSAGYQRPRAEIEQYRRANRALRRAEPRYAASRRAAAEAEALRTHLADLRADRKDLYAFEENRCEEAARRLKAEASLIIRRLRRSADLPWFRRRFGGRGSFADDQPTINIVRPRQPSEPRSADGQPSAEAGQP